MTDRGNIKIEKKIGKGSFGEVFSGIDTDTGTKIAIKRINKKELYKYGDYLINAFWKELDCMKRCECENSVKLIKNFETEHNYNIIMELCDTDLAIILEQRKKGFDTEELREILKQLNVVLKIMSDNHIIHRDLKLGNILVKYTNEEKTKFIPKLTDYGFSKDLNNCNTGTHLGTPATMAPEIMMNKQYNEKADLWSLGVLIYQLHFKSLPYVGFNEKQILFKINTKVPFKQAEDPVLRDLINKLLVPDPNLRMSWDEYFEHPFFVGEKNEKYKKNNEEKINNNVEVDYNDNNVRYSFVENFDCGFKSEFFNCFVAKDNKDKKNVLIKSYKKEFIKKYEKEFSNEYEFFKVFNKNSNVIHLIKNYKDNKNNATNFVFDFVDCEILSNYSMKKDLLEEDIQKINAKLYQTIFSFSECNFQSFNFISIYSFAINKTNNEPILFDFGLNKFLISSNEMQSYYTPNPSEIESSQFPTKTNVMNYGIALLQAFCGNNLNVQIQNKQISLPSNKILSKDFSHFISKCIYRNIEKRYSWKNFQYDNFVNLNSSTTSQNSKVLLDTEILKNIFNSLITKFENISDYYKELCFTQKTPYIDEIESFLILVTFEIRIIIKIFVRNEKTPFTVQNELSCINIISEKSSTVKFNLNFANPLIKDFKIIDFNKDKEIIEDFICKLRKYLGSITRILKNVQQFSTNNIKKMNYFEFLKKFIKNFEESKFHEYFFSFIRKYEQLQNNKKFVEAYKGLTIAEYLCEYILFIKGSMFESKEDKILFNQKEFVNKFDELFEEKENDNNKIEISVVNMKEVKPKYLIISFLNVLFRSFNNVESKNKKVLERNKMVLDGLLKFYPSLMQLMIKSRENMIKNS